MFNQKNKEEKPLKVALVEHVKEDANIISDKVKADIKRVQEDLLEHFPSVRNRPVNVIGPEGTAQEQKYKVQYVGTQDSELVNKSEIKDFDKHAEAQGQAVPSKDQK